MNDDDGDSYDGDSVDGDSADTDGGAVEHDCPRCGTSVRQRYYGPCPDCRAELTTRLARDGRDVEAPAYEPKVNVTANAVALRADD